MIAQTFRRSSFAAAGARFFALLAMVAFFAGFTVRGQDAVEKSVTAHPTEAAGHGAEGHGGAAGPEKPEEGIPTAAPKLFGSKFFSSSMLVTWIVAAGIIFLAQAATKKIRSTHEAALQAPQSGLQNFWEFLVESLRDFLEQIIGRELVKKTFWFFATVFIFILFTNWVGLIPGVGTIGWGHPGPHGFEIKTPLFRGGNADLNMTFAMAMIFFACWTVWGLQSNGAGGMVKHLFSPKGKTTGAVKVFMIIIFLGVGCLEVVSILFRPVSLSLRLYGNIFAGENLLESMSHVVPALGMIIPLPFYFMELLVGLVQALVFMLLTAVFTLLICSHDEGHGDEHAKEHGKH